MLLEKLTWEHYTYSFAVVSSDNSHPEITIPMISWDLTLNQACHQITGQEVPTPITMIRVWCHHPLAENALGTPQDFSPHIYSFYGDYVYTDTWAILRVQDLSIDANFAVDKFIYLWQQWNHKWLYQTSSRNC